MDYRQEYDKWCNDPYFDEQTREELKAIAGDEKEIEDRFYRTLEFGTAGLRGVIGAGTNRMNIYTVRQATQGLANYILAQGGQEKGVAIAHDSRLMADEFTDAAALCLAANGIRTYVFKSLRPVPELSFAVRKLGCIAGIVITASHNPREYNGYKVYWEDGAQVTPPHDTGIMAEVAKVTSFDMVKTMEKEKAQAEGLYQIISDDVDESYFAELRNLSIHPEIIKKMAKDIKIVYTPLHGTGLGPVKRVLSDLGFENVYIEPQQAVADGHFPTAPYPNPENPDAWEPQLFIGLLSQRLVQLICPHCRRPWHEVATERTDDERRLVESVCNPDQVYLRNHEGCPHCWRGVTGRTVIAEVISPDARFFQLYREKGRIEARTYWHRELGGMTRNQHLLGKINSGQVDPLAAHYISPIDEDSYTLLH